VVTREGCSGEGARGKGCMEKALQGTGARAVWGPGLRAEEATNGHRDAARGSLLLCQHFYKDGPDTCDRTYTTDNGVSHY